MTNIPKFSDFEKNSLKEEEEGKIYLHKLQKMSEMIGELLQIIKPEDDLEAWVQDKITISEHNLDAILGYYSSDKGVHKTKTKTAKTQPKSKELLIDRK